MTPQRNDGVILHSGQRGIVTSGVFRMHSYDPDYRCVRIQLDEGEFPVDLRAVAEVWRRGQRVDMVTQLAMFE